MSEDGTGWRQSSPPNAHPLLCNFIKKLGEGWVQKYQEQQALESHHLASMPVAVKQSIIVDLHHSSRLSLLVPSSLAMVRGPCGSAPVHNSA